MFSSGTLAHRFYNVNFYKSAFVGCRTYNRLKMAILLASFRQEQRFSVAETRGNMKKAMKIGRMDLYDEA